QARQVPPIHTIGQKLLTRTKTAPQGYRCNYNHYTSFLYSTEVFIIGTNCEILFFHSATTKVLKFYPT
ncbi:MAG: hypothetical protein ACI3WS_07295, partial [Phascolarctobacterium sp.]